MSASIIKYQYALDESGKTVCIKDGMLPKDRKYYCPSCGEEMRPVQGMVKVHHFRHLGKQCCLESYLHKTAKVILKERFNNSDTFPIELEVGNDCEFADTRCPFSYRFCNKDTIFNSYDLKKFYTQCEVEKWYKGFIGDVVLSDGERCLFLEINVSHPCEQDKIDSGIAIIEFDVKTLDDLDWLKHCDIVKRRDDKNQDPKIRFYNFKRVRQPQHKELHTLAFSDKGEFCLGYTTCNEWPKNHSEHSIIEVCSTYRGDLFNILLAVGNRERLSEKFRRRHYCKLKYCGCPALRNNDDRWCSVCNRFYPDIKVCTNQLNKIRDTQIFDYWIRKNDNDIKHGYEGI